MLDSREIIRRGKVVNLMSISVGHAQSAGSAIVNGDVSVGRAAANRYETVVSITSSPAVTD